MIFVIAAAIAVVAPAAHASPPRQTGCPEVITSDALLCRALEAQKSGNPGQAAQSFEEAAKSSLERDPATARMWAAAGNMWIAADQPGKASLDLDKALASTGLKGEQRGEVLLDRARAAEAQDDLVTARAKLTEAVQAIPDDPFYWYFSAALAIRENDLATAQSAIGKALTLAPSDATILFEAGHVAHFAGNDDQARSYWARAAANDPNGTAGKEAAKAAELLGVTPTVKNEAPSPRK